MAAICVARAQELAGSASHGRLRTRGVRYGAGPNRPLRRLSELRIQRNKSRRTSLRFVQVRPDFGWRAKGSCRLVLVCDSVHFAAGFREVSLSTPIRNSPPCWPQTTATWDRMRRSHTHAVPKYASYLNWGRTRRRIRDWRGASSGVVETKSEEILKVQSSKRARFLLLQSELQAWIRCTQIRG